jgi:collagenase-like PrtC family protease
VKIALHLHHLNQIHDFSDPLVDFILTEPLYSYKHPYVSDKTSFLDLLRQVLETKQKTYVEINGFIEEGDLEGLKTWIDELLTYPISGFLFADLSVLMFLKEARYTGETVYAPETILTNTLEARILLKSVDRIMISKELTLQESLILCAAFPNKVDVFGAGHLQMSVSRRPLLSSYLSHIGHESDVLNKTDYTIRELKRKEKMPVLEEAKTFCVFTQDILNPLEELPQLIQAQAHSLHLDPLFIVEDSANAFFKLILSQVQAYDETKNTSFYKEHPLPLFKGYYYRKTNMSKEIV